LFQSLLWATAESWMPYTFQKYETTNGTAKA